MAAADNVPGHANTASNGKAALSWPTVALIIASGGLNLLGTHQGNTQLSGEQQEGLRRIRELHSELDDFKRWQDQALDNQQRMLQSDSKLLAEIHEIAVRLDRLKTQEQMRGAPP